MAASVESVSSESASSVGISVWWFVRPVLKYRKTLENIGLGGLVRRVQKPIQDIFGGRVNLMIAGGAATKPEVESFYESLGIAFVQGYGMTETVGPFCCSRPVKHRVPLRLEHLWAVRNA